jgi:hypothetical protein
MTKDEIVEMLQSHPDHEGWVGIVCWSCPFPKEVKLRVTANVPLGEWIWICPKCRFHTIVANAQTYPIFPSPTYGVSGLAIMEAYEELGYNIGKYLTELEKETL